MGVTELHGRGKREAEQRKAEERRIMCAAQRTVCQEIRTGRIL